MPGRVDSTGNTLCVAGDAAGPGPCNDPSPGLNTFSCVCDIPDVPFPGDDINDAEEAGQASDRDVLSGNAQSSVVGPERDGWTR